MSADAPSVGVVGLGLLGRGIVTCLLAHGRRVVAYTNNPADFAAARQVISLGLCELIDRAGFNSALAEGWPSAFTEAGSWEDLADCDFIIETVTEELAVKRRVLEQIERVIPSSAPIGTNSSGFSLAALREGMRHPGRLVAMHWAEPAYATRFMELVRDNETDRAAFDATMSLVHSLGKDPCVLNRDVDGLVVNRLAYAMYREAIHLVQSGVCDAKTIDRAFRNSVGLWAPVMGPFGWMQFTGLQAYQRVMRRLWPTLSNTVAPPDSLSDVIAETDARPPQELNRAFRENVWRMMRNA